MSVLEGARKEVRPLEAGEGVRSMALGNEERLPDKFKTA